MGVCRVGGTSSLVHGAAAAAAGLSPARLRLRSGDLVRAISTASSAEALPEGFRFGRYVLHKRIGAGHFGDVYSGRNSTSGAQVAIKVEAAHITTTKPRLPLEAQVYQEIENGVAPRLLWFGRANGLMALVMERLGPSLRAAHRASNMRLDVDAVRWVGRQSLQRLQVQLCYLPHISPHVLTCCVAVWLPGAARLWVVAP